MPRGIAGHVVAGILVVGVGTSHAQESIPKPAAVETRDVRLECVAGIEADMGVTVATAPNSHGPDTSEKIKGRQDSNGSPQNPSDSPRPKAGPTRRWFSGATRRMLEILLSVCGAVGAGD
jgi:hypothetical protein